MKRVIKITLVGPEFEIIAALRFLDSIRKTILEHWDLRFFTIETIDIQDMEEAGKPSQ